MFTARMLFADSPGNSELSRLDLSNRTDRKQVKEIIMPAAIACREAIIAEPRRILEIMQEYRNRESNKTKEALVKSRLDRALAAMPSDQSQIIVYGLTLWPSENHTYDQARAAAWHFKGMVSAMCEVHKTPKSTGMAIRQSIKWLSEYARFRDAKDSEGQQNFKVIFQLVSQITLSWELDPEGVCKWPPYPHIGEGKW